MFSFLERPLRWKSQENFFGWTTCYPTQCEKILNCCCSKSLLLSLSYKYTFVIVNTFYIPEPRLWFIHERCRVVMIRRHLLETWTIFTSSLFSHLGLATSKGAHTTELRRSILDSQWDRAEWTRRGSCFYLSVQTKIPAPGTTIVSLIINVEKDWNVYDKMSKIFFRQTEFYYKKYLCKMTWRQCGAGELGGWVESADRVGSRQPGSHHHLTPVLIGQAGVHSLSVLLSLHQPILK